MRVREHLDLGKEATFVPNKKESVYNWFYYKEGFSRNLAKFLLAKLRPSQGVLDPFCGVGTTLLACQEQGIPSTGLDVSQIAVFASRVKTARYDPDTVFQAIKTLFKHKHTRPDTKQFSSIVQRAFPTPVLQKILSFKEAILEMHGPERDLLLLALVHTMTKCTYAVKDGAVLKINKKRNIPPVDRFFRRTAMRFLHDIKTFERTGTESEVLLMDARRMKLREDSFDAVITSPPYLNKIEYTKVYSIEQELFFKGQEPGIRSAIGLDKSSDFMQDSAIPLIAQAYFKDMNEAFKNLSRVCSEHAKMAIVVGNGCFPTGVVESDIILAGLAQDYGFEPKELWVVNKRACTKNRTKKIGVARESIVFLER